MISSMTGAEVVNTLLAAVETREEGEILRDLMVRCDLLKVCTECQQEHRQESVLCADCAPRPTA